MKVLVQFYKNIFFNLEDRKFYSSQGLLDINSLNEYILFSYNIQDAPGGSQIVEDVKDFDDLYILLYSKNIFVSTLERNKISIRTEYDKQINLLLGDKKDKVLYLNSMTKNLKIPFVKEYITELINRIKIEKKSKQFDKNSYEDFFKLTVKNCAKLNKKKLLFMDGGQKIIDYKFGNSILGRLSGNILNLRKERKNKILNVKLKIDFITFGLQFIYYDIFGEYVTDILERIKGECNYKKNRESLKREILMFLSGHYEKNDVDFFGQFVQSKLAKKMFSCVSGFSNYLKSSEKSKLTIQLSQLPEEYKFKLDLTTMPEKWNKTNIIGMNCYTVLSSLYALYYFNKNIENIILFIHDEFIFKKDFKFESELPFKIQGYNGLQNDEKGYI